MKDFYKTLGVDKTATEAEIKKAYKKLAIKYHPDKNQGDKEAEETFKKISEAYATLSDKNKRQAYDNPQPSFGGFGVNMDDFFHANQQHHQQQQHVQVQKAITLKEAVFGASVDIDLQYNNPCKPCKETGYEGGKVTTCRTCNGIGMVALAQGAFRIQQTCPSCRGKKYQPDTSAEKCTACKGAGHTPGKKHLNVKVPAGIQSQQMLGLKNVDFEGIGNRNVYVNILVQEEADFQQVNNDIITKMSLPLTTAILGGKQKVVGLEGVEYEAEIPEGTQAGEFLVIKKNYTSSGGDLYGMVSIKIPKGLSEDSKKRVEDMKGILGC